MFGTCLVAIGRCAPRLAVQAAVNAVALVVEPLLDAFAAIVQPLIDTFAAVVQSLVDAFALVVETLIDAIAAVLCQRRYREHRQYGSRDQGLAHLHASL